MKWLYKVLSTTALLSLCALFLSASGDPRLDRAKELFRDGAEDTCRQAARICREVNNVDAAEIMLEVLDSTGFGPSLPAGHYRDIVWEEIVSLTDPYAKARVELELKKNKSNAWTRAWCAQLLGIYGDQDFALSLTKALKDKDAKVRAAAAEALGKLPLPVDGAASVKAIKALSKVSHGKDPMERANAWIAMLKLNPGANRVAYLAATEGRAADKDGGTRCAMLGALKEISPSDVEAVSARALDDEDWRVRLQAIEHLGTTKSKTAIDRLMECFDDPRPILVRSAVTHLRALTGQVHREPQAWQAWWAEKRDSFEFPEGDAEAEKPTSEGLTVAVYNGIRVDSDHVAFLIDKSSAMAENLSSQGMSKEIFAQKQLEEVLGQLPEGVHFNVYTYELDFEVFSEKEPAEVGKKSIRKALDFVDDQPLRGSKDIWQILEHVVSNPEIDTIYLLSSGEPDTGKYVHWNRVTEHLIDINRFQKVTVHTIAYTESKWFQDQLEKIALASGGEFKWFD